MDWQVLIAVGLSVFLWRDACLLSVAGAPRAAHAAVQLAGFAALGVFAETVSRDEAYALLRDPRIAWPAAGLHLGLWAALYLGGRRKAAWLHALALAPAPVFVFSAGGLVWSLLQHTRLGSGLAAGCAGAAAWLAAAHLLALILKQFRPTTLETFHSFAAASNLTAILLIPLQQTAVTGDAMNVETIHDLLYFLSNLFLLPTLLGTLAAFAWSTFVVGQFLSEWGERRVNRKHLRNLFSGPPTESRFRESAWRGHFAGFLHAREQYAEFPAMLDKHVSDLEHRLAGRLERLGILAKVGPMLGLIGTLIPLQPALAGLARGDMQAMGANLQIGFTTTVLGLISGGTCYAVSVILRHWYQQDLTDIHFLNALWAEPDGSSTDAQIQPDIAAIGSANGNPLAAGRQALRRAER